MNEILVLYYSRQGSTAALARQICRGVESVSGMQARLRTVAPVAVTTERPDPAVPSDGPPYASHGDRPAADAVASSWSSPTRFGNMAAPDEILPRRHERAMAVRAPSWASRPPCSTSTQTCTAVRIDAADPSAVR